MLFIQYSTVVPVIDAIRDVLIPHSGGEDSSTRTSSRALAQELELKPARATQHRTARFPKQCTDQFLSQGGRHLPQPRPIVSLVGGQLL